MRSLWPPLGARARQVTKPQRVWSAKCRGIRWRRAKQHTQRSRDHEIRVLVETALKKLEEGAT